MTCTRVLLMGVFLSVLATPALATPMMLTPKQASICLIVPPPATMAERSPVSSRTHQASSPRIRCRGQSGPRSR